MKKRSKRLIAVITILCLLMSTAVVSADTVSAANTYSGYKIQQNYSIRSDSWINQEMPGDYYYSDGYFKTATTKYNKHLATMCLALSMAFMPNGTDSIRATLEGADFGEYGQYKGLGCKNAEIQDVKDGKTGVAIAAKSVAGGKDNLVIVVLRGNNYESEWAENFNLGSTGDALGFKTQADEVYGLVNSYISNHKISTKSAKILVTGYGRGGAIGSLAAAKLSDKYGKSKIYGYAFSAQKVADSSSKKLVSANKSYTNIWTVNNRYDLIASMMPSWLKSGYTEFGTKGGIKTIGSTSEKKMIDQLLAYENLGEYSGIITEQYVSPANFKMKKLGIKIDFSIQSKLPELLEKGLDGIFIDDPDNAGITQDKFITLFFNRLKQVIPTREDYAKKIAPRVVSASEKIGTEAITVEKTAMTLFPLIKSADPEKLAKLEDIDIMTLKEPFLKLMPVISRGAILEDAKYIELVEEVWGIIEKNGLTDLFGKEHQAEFKKVIPQLIDVAVKIMSKDFDKEDKEDKYQVLITALMNLDSLKQAHKPEIQMGWLRLQDDFYVNSANVTPFSAKPKNVTGGKLSAGKKSFTVKWKKASKPATGYQLQYGLKSNFKNAKTVNITKASTVKTTVKKLKAKKTYYVRIRSIVKLSDWEIDGNWVKIGKVKTKK